jgi:hypothetical protein
MCAAQHGDDRDGEDELTADEERHRDDVEPADREPSHAGQRTALVSVAGAARCQASRERVSAGPLDSSASSIGSSARCTRRRRSRGSSRHPAST